MAPPTPPSTSKKRSGTQHQQSTTTLSQNITTILDRQTTHERLQYLRNQVEKDLSHARLQIEDPEEQRRLPLLSLDDIRGRIMALQEIQAMVRAFLRRVQDNMAFWQSDAAAGAGAGGQQREGGNNNPQAAGLVGQGQTFEAMLAETEALIGGYLCLAFVHGLVGQNLGVKMESVFLHVVQELEVPFAVPGAGEGDFDLVREEVRREVWKGGADDEDDMRAPLEGLLGLWRKDVVVRGRGMRGRLLSVQDAAWVPWKVLMERLRRGPPPTKSNKRRPQQTTTTSSSKSFIEEVSEQVTELRVLMLYALADAWEASITHDLPVQVLRTRLAEPFATQVGIPRSLALMALAYWAADRRDRSGSDELALISGGGKGLLSSVLLPRPEGGKKYRQLLWTLAYQGRYSEAAHLLDAAPPPGLTPLDGCLMVGVLLGLGQWQQAFVQQRELATIPRGPLCRLPPSQRLAPLKLLAYRLVGSGHVEWLAGLPFNPIEMQHVVSTLYLSDLNIRDHALLALLLKRKQFTRAWAVFYLVGEEMSEERGKMAVAKEDLRKLIQGVERFIPKEELEVMKKARENMVGGEGLQMLELFARLSPVEEGGEGQEEEERARMEEQEREEEEEEEGEEEKMDLRGAAAGAGGGLPLQRPSASKAGPKIPGRRSSFGGSNLEGLTVGGVGLGLGGSRRMYVEEQEEGAAAAAASMEMETSYLAAAPRGVGLMSRSSAGAAGGEGAGAGGAGGVGKLRSPPVALRPGWSSRKDGNIGAGGGGGGSGIGGGVGGGSREREEKLV